MVLSLTEDQSETQDITELSGNGIFQLRVRQAILAAQHSIKQVGLLLIAFDNSGNPLTAPDDHVTEFSEAMWMRLRNALRDSDTVVRMNSGEMAVLLPSVNGPEDVVLVANKILSKLEEPLCIQGDRKSTRLNSSHVSISYAVFCLKKKNT